MLTCSSCRERCLQALLGGSATSSPILRIPFAANIGREHLSRSYGTTTSTSPVRRELPLVGREPPVPEKKNRPPDTVPSGRGVRPRGGRTPGYPFQISRKDQKFERLMGGVLQNHPNYGRDPLKLADYVRKALNGDDYETALGVVRAASKNLACTVSWNHLIDWNLSKGKMNEAFKIYNEMKKRGQKPDNYTFTILIRGCTEHRDLDQAVEKIMGVYHSLQSKSSELKPNGIHVNAILKLCGRAGNLDAMFEILADMPPRGPMAPNNFTFTTVLNALRSNTDLDFRSTLTPVEKRENAQKVILTARRIWMDIVVLWRKGSLRIDEELVCAMGRLMLLGKIQDVDDILSLIEQVMNIPRKLPKLHSEARKLIDPSSQGRQSHEKDQDPDFEDMFEVSPEINQVSGADTTKAARLAPVQSSGYAQPGNNALSLVLKALLTLNKKAAASLYWDAFVEEHQVLPDLDNYHAYLRILRVSRSSGETVKVLQSMAPTLMTTTTFRIAISTCERDKNNPLAFYNASKIVDIMTSSLETPSVWVLNKYLEVAMVGGAGSPKNMTDDDTSKKDHGKQITRAFTRLNPSLINVKTFLVNDDPAAVNMTREEFDETREDVFSLVRRMISACDIQVSHELVHPSKFEGIRQQSSKLHAFVTRQARRKFQKSNGDIQALPPHLQRYVETHQLNEAMGRAQVSALKWESFVEGVEAEYEFQKKHPHGTLRTRDQIREAMKSVDGTFNSREEMLKALKSARSKSVAFSRGAKASHRLS